MRNVNELFNDMEELILDKFNWLASDYLGKIEEDIYHIREEGAKQSFRFTGIDKRISIIVQHLEYIQSDIDKLYEKMINESTEEEAK